MQREQIERDGPGRREEDFRPKCLFCDMKDSQSKERWKTLDEKTKEREATCSKIIEQINGDVEDIKKDQKSFVRWPIITMLVVILMAVLGTFSAMNLSNQNDIKSVVKEIQTTTNAISTKVAVFEKEIKDLNERQDVLRNAHMKLMNDKK